MISLMGISMRGATLLGLIVLAASCSDVRTELVPLSVGPSTPSGDGDGDGDAAVGEDASTPNADAGTRAMCGPKICKCDDGMDNDRDHLIDGLDPECTARFDNDEETFATGRPNVELPTCEDCFWDDNDDSADDGCAYPSACRSEGSAQTSGPPGMPMAGGPMMCDSCEVTPRCIDACRSHTPNGCDCFGCCEIAQPDGTVNHVVLGDECAVKHAGDPHKCPACVPNAECANPCGRCELCLGKRAEDLPADCGTAGSSDASIAQQCDDGYQACAEDGACPDGYYCVLGCCLITLF